MAVAPEAVKLFGPVHLKVVPEVEELPVSATEVVLQVSKALLGLSLTAAPGALLLDVTVTVAVPVPAEFVAVTV